MSSQEIPVPLEEQAVFCEIGGQEFEYKHAFAAEHMKKYLMHISYRTEKKI